MADVAFDLAALLGASRRRQVPNIAYTASSLDVSTCMQSLAVASI